MKTRKLATLPVPLTPRQPLKTIEVLEARIAPAAVLNVTKVAVFAPGGDVNGDGNFDPGDSILYTVTLTNSGDVDLTGVTFTDILDANLTQGSVNVSPLAMDDIYSTPGNTLLEVGVPHGTSPAAQVAGGVFANDTDFLGDTFSLSTFDATSAQGGTVAMNPAGQFTYLPAAGFSGTDTFQYTIEDKGLDGIADTADDLTSVGTVTITVGAQKVWYVDNSYTGANGASDGRSTRPFTSLAPLTTGGTADTLDGAGDIIFIHQGTGAAYANTLLLEANQTLHGQGTALNVNGFALVSAGVAPTIAPGTGAAVTLSTGNTLTGFTIGNAQRDIVGSAFGTLTVTNVTLTGTGKTLDLNDGTFATGSSFISVSTTGTSGLGTNGHGMELINVHGSVNFGSTTMAGTEMQGIFVSNSDAAITFGNTSVGSPSATSGVEAIRFETNSGGTRSFGTLTVSASQAAGIGMSISDTAGTVSTSGAASFTNISANALNVSGGANVGFQSLSLATIGGAGITLNNHTGTFNTGTGGTIATVTGDDVRITGGTGAVTITQAITNTAGKSVFIDNHETGNVTISGSISDTGTGITVQNVNSGTIAFSGASHALSTGANAAVTLSGNANGTINFTGGALVITTTSGAGFTASGGGTISVTGASNTISSTTGTALSVVSTNIGSDDLTFRRISAGTATGSAGNGIVLDTTGNAGGLRVTGNGSIIGASGGGVIQHKTGADGSTTGGNGIYLNNTAEVSLNGMQLNDFDNHGIFGLSVNGFKLTNSTIGGVIGTSSGSNDLTLEAPIQFGRTSPSLANGLSGSSLIDNVNISGGIQHNVEIYQDSGSFSLTISNSNIHDNSAALGADGINIETTGTATAFIKINNTIFDDNKSQAVQANALGNSTLHLTLDQNTVTRTTQGNEGFILQNGAGADLFTAVTNNTFTGINGTNIFVGNVVLNATSVAELHATISGNAMTVPAPTNRTLVAFFSSTAGQVSTSKVLIDNNTINTVSDPVNGLAEPLFVSTPDAGSTPLFYATVSNNKVNITDPTGTALRGIAVQATQSGAAGHIDVRGNDVTYINEPGGAQSPAGVNGIRVRQASSATLDLEPGVGGANAAAALAANNPAPHTSGTEVLGTVTLSANNNTALLPTAPTAPTAPAFLTFAPSSDRVTEPSTTEDTSQAENHPPTVVPQSDENVSVIVDDGILSRVELESLIAAAIARWDAVGISPEQAALLRTITFSIEDMPGWYLGSAAPGHITLDLNAAGNSWFIDPTPYDDREFSGTGTQLFATIDGGATGRIDALSTLVHELGHQLGLEDTFESTQAANLMYGLIHQGERRLPAMNQAAGAEPHFVAGDLDFAIGPVNIGSLPVGKSVKIVFTAQINNDISSNQISNQGTASSTQTGNVLSDDPAVAGTANPTVTLVNLPDVSVAVSPASVTEDAGGQLIYTFTRTGPTDFARTINFSVGGSATAGTDYTQAGAASFTPTAGTVTFAAGSATATVTLTPTADTAVELNESVVLAVGTGTGYDVGTPNEAIGTIINDDTEVSVSVAPASVTEDGAGNLVYAFTRNGATSGTLTANYSLSGTAASADDFTVSFAPGSATFDGASSTGTVIFAPGATTVTITVDPTADSIVEADETAIATVTSGTGYNVAGSPATGAITNDDADVSLAIAPASVTEDGAANLVYTFTRAGFIATPLTVNFTVGGTATFNSDYGQTGAATFASTSGTITFAAGSATATLTVDPITDSVAEPDEIVAITLGSGTGYNVVTAGAINGTIRNDDTVVSVAVSPASVQESSTTGLVYTFTRTGDTTAALPINFTKDGTAGSGNDYTASSTASTFDYEAGTLSIPAGQSSVTVTLVPVDDRLVEGSETAVITVAPGDSYGIGGSPATGTFSDNDTATLSFASGSSTALESVGMTDVGVTLTINAVGTGSTGLASDITANLFTAIGSATGGGTDYALPTSPAVTFSAGTYATGTATQNATVAITDDRLLEGPEQAVLNLNVVQNIGSQVSVGGATSHMMSITDNESATLSFTAGASTALESAGAKNIEVSFTINSIGTGTVGTAFAVSANIVSFNHPTAVAPATGGGVDFTVPSSPAVTFFAGTYAAGTATQNAVVTITDDRLVEGDEFTQLQLFLLPSAGLGQVSVVGTPVHALTISDNDTATLSFTAGTGTAIESIGTQDVGATLTISAVGTGNIGLASDFTANLTHTGGTATSGGTDFALPATPAFTFLAGTYSTGTATQIGAVAITDDRLVEGSETALLGLSIVQNIGTQVVLEGLTAHTLTINDNDTATLSFTAGTSTALESAGTHNIGATLTFNSIGTGTIGLASTLTANLAGAGGTASGGGTDYTLPSNPTFTFLAGAYATGTSTQNGTIAVTDDRLVEGDETIALAVSIAQNIGAQVTLGALSAHTLSVTDNDTATLSFTSGTSTALEAAGTHSIGTTLTFSTIGAGTIGLASDVAANLVATGGTATGGGVDYTLPANPAVTFLAGAYAAGTATQNVVVTIIGDTLGEADETAVLELSVAQNIGTQVNVGGTTAHTLTIDDDDTAVSVTVGPSVLEGSAAGLVYTFTRTGDTTTALTVNFSYDGTATIVTDYTQAGAATFAGGLGTIVIPIGQVSATVTLTSENDTLVEGAETVAFTIQPGANYGIGAGSTATGTIDDNDFAVIRFTNETATADEDALAQFVSIELLVTADGVPGTGTLARPVSVNLAAAATGSAGGADFTFSTPQTITYNPGQGTTVTNVPIGIIDDRAVEGNETIDFQLNTLTDGTGGGVTFNGPVDHMLTIRDNDSATIGFVAASSTTTEDGTPQATIGLVINAVGSGPAIIERPVSLTVATTGGTATGGGTDYTFANPQTITFAAGSAAGTQAIAITLNNDTIVEGDETIVFTADSLADGTGGRITQSGSAQHTLTITDNDTATLQFVTGTGSVNENGGKYDLGVSLLITANGVPGSGTLGREISFSVTELAGDTATLNADYTVASYTGSFGIGATSGTVTKAIAIEDDSRVEGSETAAFGLQFTSDVTGGLASLGAQSTHTLTIADNDTATVSLVTNGTVINESGGSLNVGFALVITANGVPNSGTLERNITIDLTDAGVGSATGGGSDYTFASPQTVTFASGESSSVKNVSVGLIDDTRLEGTETIVFAAQNFSDATNGAVTFAGGANHAVTLQDNESAVIELAADAALVSESAGTLPIGVTLVITANGVANSGTLERAISVDLTDVLPRTATPGGVDYSFASPQTLTFEAGESSSTKSVPITVTNDAISEGNETLSIQLGGLNDPTGRAILGSRLATGVTIADDDVDLAVTTTESANVVVAGGGVNLTYTITVANHGLTDATGVVLAENLTLPAGVTLISITPSVGTYQATTEPDGSWTIGSLSSGSSATLTIVLSVEASAPEGTDLIGSVASISTTNENAVNVGNDVSTESTSIDRQVDLQVTKTDSVTPATPGGTLRYAINFANGGPSDATGVVITETLPAGTTFNAAGSTGTWVEGPAGTFSLAVGTLAPTASGSATFAVTVGNPATAGLNVITNTASIADDGTAGADVNPANNTASDSNTLDAAPDLQVSVVDDPSVAQRGGSVRYVVSYANVGNQDSTGVFVTITLPANTAFDPIQSTAGWTNIGGDVYRIDLGNVDAGDAPQSVTFAIEVNSNLPGGYNVLSTIATIDDDHANGVDPAPANNSESEDTPIYQGIYVVAPGVAVPGKRSPAVVRVFDIATGVQTLAIDAYGTSYRDSVRVAVGDINGDGFDDIITSTRTGDGRVRVFDGITGERFEGPFAELAAFAEAGAKGAFVASGDVTGDGRDDIIVGSGQGARGGGKVKVFDGVTGDLVSTSEPFGSRFRGGVRVAVGDVNGDNVADIIASQGYGGNDLRVTSGASNDELLRFDVGGPRYRGGVFVAAADLNGDGVADIIAGRDRGPTVVETFNGSNGQMMDSIVPFASKYRLGARVAAADVNLDGVVDIIVGAGGRGKSEVKIFSGLDKTVFHSFQAFPMFPTGSLFVAGTSPVPGTQTVRPV